MCTSTDRISHLSLALSSRLSGSVVWKAGHAVGGRSVAMSIWNPAMWMGRGGCDSDWIAEVGDAQSEQVTCVGL